MKKTYSTYGTTRGVWHTVSVKIKSTKRDDQKFRILQMFSPYTEFTYKQLKENFKACMDHAKEEGLGTSGAAYIQLEEFLLQFMTDVEERFPQ